MPDSAHNSVIVFCEMSGTKKKCHFNYHATHSSSAEGLLHMEITLQQGPGLARKLITLVLHASSTMLPYATLDSLVAVRCSFRNQTGASTLVSAGSLPQA